MVENGIEDEEHLLLPFSKLELDLKVAATMGRQQARYVVDTYYEIQGIRLATTDQVRWCKKQGEPAHLLEWLASGTASFEHQLKRALEAYANNDPTGRWALGIYGIGPVLSAGLLASIDITKAPTVGHIWRFAGLDPTQEWLGRKAAQEFVAQFPKDTPLWKILRALAKRIGCRENLLHKLASTDKNGKPVGLTRESLARAGALRPWDARLKCLCWKIGESFVKVSNHEKSFYGRLYRQRKEYEWDRNLKGDYAELAKQTLSKRRFGVDTVTRKWYEGRISAKLVRQWLEQEDRSPNYLVEASEKTDGQLPMLPPAHIHARATRWVVKLFLSHWHAQAYRNHYGAEPPKPYAQAHLGHAHMIEVSEAS